MSNLVTTTSSAGYSPTPSSTPPSNRRPTIRDGVRIVVGRHLIWPLLGMLIIIGAFVPGFLSAENLTNVVWSATPLGCMALGMFFVMVTAALDLSIESTFVVAPVIAILIVTSWLVWIPAIFAIPVLIVVGATVGLLNGLLSVKLKVNPFLVTLATMLILRGVAVYLIPEGVYNLPSVITYLGGAKVGPVPIAVLVFLILVALSYLLVEHTPFGKSLFAIGSNEPAAFVAGINVSRVKIITFLLAGVAAAIGGLLQVGRLDSITSDMGEGQILMVFAAATLGGTALTGGEGRVTGILGAALVIAVIDNIMNLVGIEPSIRRIVFGVILLVAIYLASLQERILWGAHD